ncbi:MAG: hypothetical protein KJ556_20525 [Gammaproteobacteria bacterium]|nr:hypothetical protein [Gammaproteobacteria bacterium]
MSQSNIPALILGAASYFQNKENAKNAAATANRLTTTQENVSREAMSLARQQYGDMRMTNQLLAQLAARVLGEASLYDNPTMKEGFERLTGMYLSTLRGEDPANFDVYSPQFKAIDSATEIERRKVRESYATERQQIADTIPRGSARISLLADMSRKAADAENSVVAQATRRKEDLAIKVRQQAMTDASAFFKATPDQRVALIKTAGNILAGSPVPSTGELIQAGGLTNTTLSAAVKQLENAQAGTGALMQLAGAYFTSKDEKEKPLVEPYSPPVVVNIGKKQDYTETNPYKTDFNFGEFTT